MATYIILVPMDISLFMLLCLSCFAQSCYMQVRLQLNTVTEHIHKPFTRQRFLFFVGDVSVSPR